MKRILLLLTIGFVVFVALNRERIFLRDPLGRVERSGVRVAGAKVFINYPNDALVQEGSQFYLVQGWNKIPGVPAKISCVRELACLTDQDHAHSLPLQVGGRPASAVMMSDREISFVNGSGSTVRITLR